MWPRRGRFQPCIVGRSKSPRGSWPLAKPGLSELELARASGKGSRAQQRHERLPTTPVPLLELIENGSSCRTKVQKLAAAAGPADVQAAAWHRVGVLLYLPSCAPMRVVTMCTPTNVSSGSPRRACLRIHLGTVLPWHLESSVRVGMVWCGAGAVAQCMDIDTTRTHARTHATLRCRWLNASSATSSTPRRA